jgi:dTDP-4-dehydrorhamnose 3,5-epimerase
LRPWSPTSLQLQTFVMESDEPSYLFIPAGCAHGFQALDERDSDVHYRINRAHNPDDERVVNALDPELGIPWPLSPALLNKRDHDAPTLSSLKDDLAAWFPQPIPAS